MKLFDELKRLTHPYEDDMDDDYEDEDDVYEDESEPEDQAPPPPPRREEARRREYRQDPPPPPPRQEPPRSQAAYSSINDKVVNINATTQVQVVLVKPKRYENSVDIAEHLRARRTVVLNLEETDDNVGRRLMDFLSGVAYAQEGEMKKVAKKTFLITPYKVRFEGDLLDEIENLS